MRKQLPEEKELLLFMDTAHNRSVTSNHDGARRRLRALVRAVHEDAARIAELAVAPGMNGYKYNWGPKAIAAAIRERGKR